MNIVIAFALILFLLFLVQYSKRRTQKNIEVYLNEKLPTAHNEVNEIIDNKHVIGINLSFISIVSLEKRVKKWVECKVLLRSAKGNFYLVEYLYDHHSHEKIHIQHIESLNINQTKKILSKSPSMYEQHFTLTTA
ncbi:hypothetical protein [uncultured Shewanella sp.]|uniref:hypothetical protein n=1 Tax=uncultured Shewanella sp. TaxID=173975 RepID=UPI0026045658|nr:hypothetical protein [uncultured Shewanella sp.]